MSTWSQRAGQQAQLALIAAALMLALVGSWYAIARGFSEVVNPPSLTTTASFLPSSIAVFAALMGDLRRRPYSLHSMHLIATGILLIAVPLQQFVANDFPNPWALSDEDIVYANLCIFAWVTCYLGGRAACQGYVRNVKKRIPLLEIEFGPDSLWVGLVLALGCLSYLSALGTGGTLTRAAFAAAFGAESIIGLSIGLVLRAVPVAVLAAWLLTWFARPTARTSTHAVVILVLLVFNAWANNPLAGARTWTLMVSLALFVVMLLARRSNGVFLIPGIVLGLLLMPGLNAGRYSENFDPAMVTPDFQAAEDSFTSGDFDAYSNLILTNRLVEAHGATDGQQLVGALLFWVPRALWPEKPVGSGAYMAGLMDLPWANISCPLPSEAVINFGFWGIPLFALIFGALVYVVDQRYYLNRTGAAPSRTRILDCVYPFWLGLMVFATRGDLINAFALTAGTTFAGYVALRLFASLKRATPVGPN